MTPIKIVSLNIGLPKKVTFDNNNHIISGIKKKPTDQIVLLKKNGFEGDDSYEDCHGGKNMAVHVFAYENYSYYNKKAGYNIALPAFGENLTLSGYNEQQARVGDVLTIGNATVQVSQPTERCKNIGLSLGLPQMLKWIHEELRTGFYFRVLEEGSVSTRSEIKLIERGNEEGSIAALNNIMFRYLDNKTLVTDACQTPHISEEWKNRLLKLQQRASQIH